MYYYLYCITKALHKPLMNVVGIGNANVHALQYEDIMAILSEIVMAKIPVSNGNVLRHAAVIEAVRKEQTVLPMRFSSVFKDDAGVIEFLKNRYAVFVSDLGRLHDKLEMGIRILSPSLRGTGGGIQGNNEYSPPLLGGVRACPVPDTWGGGELLQKKCVQNAEITQSGVEQEFGVSGQSTESPISDPQPPASPAMSYLQQRRIYYASQDENDEWVKEVIKTCHAQFEDICVKHKRDTHTSFSQGVSLNYLIHKDSLNEFKNRFNDLKSSLNELHFLCSGPWPPYHFVSPGDGRE
ncbi:MAG TPA: GvpL/GvpF family gas vesicle protein [Candidatus Wunengus sp. YC63]|uniref:GvpL/GvpF family gas vesicle protein n=1 Tax=unclassified Candidatus Wunengus TaxID=3367695 RepID=UPI0040269C82